MNVGWEVFGRLGDHGSWPTVSREYRVAANFPFPRRRTFGRVVLAVPSHYTEQMFNIVRAAKIFRIPWKFLSEMLALATARGFVGIEIGGVKESLPLTTAIKARRTRLGLAQKPECPVLYGRRGLG